MFKRFTEMFKASAAEGPLVVAEDRLREEYEAAHKAVGHPPAGFSRDEINFATSQLMTGPSATPPRWRAVRKAIIRIRHGGKIEGSWRDWPRFKGEVA